MSISIPIGASGVSGQRAMVAIVITHSIYSTLCWLFMHRYDYSRLATTIDNYRNVQMDFIVYDIATTCKAEDVHITSASMQVDSPDRAPSHSAIHFTSAGLCLANQI
jgi:hypothetical protein